jgi:5-methylcytosine-specific restriction endonuclease McrA
VCQQFRQGNTFTVNGYSLLDPGADFPTRRYVTCVFKPNPYTHQQIILKREEIPAEEYWPGFEKRAGMADLRIEVMMRDQLICQMCERPLTTEMAEVDHLKPVRRFKRPVDANTEDNLGTLCQECHQWKTEYDRRMESPLPGKPARRVR